MIDMPDASDTTNRRRQRVLYADSVVRRDAFHNGLTNQIILERGNYGGAMTYPAYYHIKNGALHTTPEERQVHIDNVLGKGIATTIPGAPTNVSATTNDTQATIAFTAPLSDGGLEILSYTVLSSPGEISFTGLASPIVLTGLTIGETYTFVVFATNANGNSASSSASNPVTPVLPMMIHIRTLAGHLDMVLPFLCGTDQCITVDWGDGVAQETYTNTRPSHTYELPEHTYTIRVSGSAQAYGDRNGYTGSNLIVSVDSWGSLGFTSLEGCFCGSTQLLCVPSYLPSTVTNVRVMFQHATLFNQDIRIWDVRNVRNMYGMFLEARDFNQDIGGWNVGNVVSMGGMFSGASAFNQMIGGWDVGKVQDMYYMFAGASAFNQDIGGWKVGNVASMSGMFSGASAFNQMIGGWDVGKVQDMYFMFANASSFNQDIGRWNVGNVTNMSGMFSGASAFNQMIGGWDVGKVTNMSSMFSGAKAFHRDIGIWNVGKVTNMSSMFAGAISFNQDIGIWVVENVSSVSKMFYGAIAFHQDISSWNFTKVEEDGAERMLQDSGIANNSSYWPTFRTLQYLLGKEIEPPAV